MSAAAGIVLLLGRVLFSVFFARSGIGHVRKHQTMGDYSRAASFPAPYLAGWPAGVWLLAASLSIALGIWPDLGSLMVAVFVVPAGLARRGCVAVTDPRTDATYSDRPEARSNRAPQAGGADPTVTMPAVRHRARQPPAKVLR